MFQSVNFTYDGISGQDMFGLMLVRVGDSGMLEQPFGISRKSVLERVKGKMKSYSYGFETEVLEFPITLTKENGWSYDERVAVSKWLIQDGYKTLVSEDYPLEFDVACVGSPKFYVGGDNKGYVELTMESNVPFGFSPVSVQEFDLSANTTTQIITLENKSNVYDIYKPEIQFTMAGSTSVKLENLTRGGEVMEFTNIQNNEILYCNCETERIFSNLSDTRLQNLSDKRFLKLAYGVNQIRITGKVLIETRMRYPMMV